MMEPRGSIICGMEPTNMLFAAQFLLVTVVVLGLFGWLPAHLGKRAMRRAWTGGRGPDKEWLFKTALEDRLPKPERDHAWEAHRTPEARLQALRQLRGHDHPAWDWKYTDARPCCQNAMLAHSQSIHAFEGAYCGECGFMFHESPEDLRARTIYAYQRWLKRHRATWRKGRRLHPNAVD